ncbi:MAG: flagellin [Planctomycetota bacterium]
MTRINTNISSLVAQNRLRMSNVDLQTALTRLSTGLRINTGSDDPAGLIASEALRSEVTSLGKAVSNTRRASQIINTADSSLSEVSTLLNDIRGLIVEAANVGALSDEEVAANQLQIDSSLEAINRIAQTTTFQGRKLLDGSLDFVTNASNVPSIEDLQIDQANLGATNQIAVDVVINSAATRGAVEARNGAFTTTGFANATFGTGGDQIRIQALRAGQDFNDVQVNFVDLADAGVDAAASASYDDDNRELTVTFNSLAATATHRDYNAIIAAIQAATNNGGASVFNAVMDAGDPNAAFVIPSGDISTEKTGGEILQDDLVFQLNGTTGAETFNFSAGTPSRKIVEAVNLVQDSTSVRASFSGGVLRFESVDFGSRAIVNLEVISEGDLGGFKDSLSGTRGEGNDIQADVNGIAADGAANTFSINTSSLDVAITVQDGSTDSFSFSITDGGALFQIGPDVVTTQQARLGIGSLSTGKLGGPNGRLYELGSGQAKSLTGDITGAAQIIDSAIDKVTSLRGRLGAFQSTTLDSNLVSLNETLSNLAEAESSIRDADFAAESANLTRAQILVQSGTNVLSLANQAPQNVLALLQ